MMATVASPTPNSFSASANGYRHVPRSLARNGVHRLYSQRTTTEPQRSITKQPTGDSSDDDDLAPVKLSAEAQAILEGNSQASEEKENASTIASHKRTVAPALEGYRSTSGNRFRKPLPSHGTGSPAPRSAHESSISRPTPMTTLGRDGSFMYKTHEKIAAHSSSPPRDRRLSPVRQHSQSPPQRQSAERPRVESHIVSPPRGDEAVEDAPPPPETISRPRKNDDHGAHSTVRMRKIGTGALSGKPRRAGMLRRPSEDDDVAMVGAEREGSNSPEMQMGRRAKQPELDDQPDIDFAPRGSPEPISRGSSGKISRTDLNQAPYLLQERKASPSSPVREPLAPRSRPTPASDGSHPSSRSGSHRRPAFKVPPLPTEAAHDQENEPPPTFKRSKPVAPVLEVLETEPEKPAPKVPSPERQPLAAVHNNVPHRPAPAPPPKMSSLLDAATANGARSKKGSSHVVINGRQYRRLDCIGRGGSSRVYRIMADNYKIFALKRVNLEEADAAAIAGYKGEIDLLNKLSHVDRVIRLFDYEVNDEKQILNVMMELGESDFNKMLNEQCKTDNAKLDITFTRHYWKEMLECVGSVHTEDVVHSDLKPANFLLVKGRLKLIDFGIANAIQDDTVNVYRENQIGTPNYMSPESLICNNVTAGEHGDVKEIKLGKPSDVWSLGCILYQMTYGQPPFAHIQSQMQRIMSIPNPKVEIQFPTRGIGGAVVPFGLIKTLRRCLTREQSLRPTIEELLADSDQFLNPVAISPDMLGRVIGNVVSYCRRREEGMRNNGELLPADGPSCLPKDEDMRGWPGAFYEKLRQAMEDGTAW